MTTNTRRGATKPRGYDASKYPAFAVTVDVVILTMVDGDLQVLLVRRGQAPFRGMWAIPGGFKSESYRHLLARDPKFPIEKAVKGMLPKNVLGRELLTKLKVYASADHPHAGRAGDLVVHRGDIAAQRLELGPDAPRPVDDDAALLGDGRGGPVDQGDTELPLEAGDVCGYVRLHRVQRARRSGEGSVVGHREQRRKLAKIHRHE